MLKTLERTAKQCSCLRAVSCVLWCASLCSFWLPVLGCACRKIAFYFITPVYFGAAVEFISCFHSTFAAITYVGPEKRIPFPAFTNKLRFLLHRCLFWRCRRVHVVLPLNFAVITCVAQPELPPALLTPPGEIGFSFVTPRCALRVHL